MTDLVSIMEKADAEATAQGESASKSKGKRRVFSYEQLTELMADVELKKREDPKAAVTLLKQLQASHVALTTLSLAKAEKFFRELSSLPISIFTSNKADFEMMKKLARDICRQWADQRRKEILYEDLMSGAALKKATTKDPKSPTFNERFESQARIASSGECKSNQIYHQL